MQSTVRFFELPAQSEMGGLCGKKVAVKMSAKDAAAMDGDAGGFAEMMAALMALPAQGMDKALPEVGWLPVEEGAREWVPLIDLSGSDETGQNMFQMLMKESANGNMEQTLFHLKMKSNPDQNTADAAVNELEIAPQDGLTDIPLAAVEAQDAETALMDAAAMDETLSAGLKKPVPFSAKTEPAGPLDPLPGLKAGPKIREGIKALKEEIQQTKAEIPLKEGAGDGWSRLEPEKAGAAQSLETVRTPLPREHQEQGRQIGEHKAQTDRAPVDLLSQGTKTVNADAQSTKGQDHQRRSAEDPGRQHITMDAEAINNASSNTAGSGSASSPSTVLSNDGKSAFQAHLQNNIAAGNGASRTDAGISTDSAELQTDVIRQIVQRMTMRADGHTSQMQVKLKPEFLGNMQMDIITQNQQVMIRMTAENHKVKDIIEQNIHLLKAEMQQHGLQVNKIDVFVAQDQDSWKNGQQQTAFQQAHDRGRQQGEYRGGRRESGSETPWTAGMATASKGTGGKTSEVDLLA